MLPVSVAGGYWTGSGSVVDLLAEHSQCKVFPGEFMLFSFGQFFKEVTYPLIAGHPLDQSFDSSIERLLEFNRSERFPALRAAARRLFAGMGVYPHFVFSRRAGMFARLGKDYAAACDNLTAKLRNARESNLRPTLPEFRAAIQTVLDEAIKGAHPNREDEARIGVFDQLVGPPYIRFAVDALPRMRYINVDRDWRDQYISLRNIYKRMTQANRCMAVRPWDETPEEYDAAPMRYFVGLRRRIDRVKAQQLAEGRKDVLWLRFEDVVLDRDNIANKVFKFLGIDRSNWTPGMCFHPEVSSKRIGKWRVGEWQQSPLKHEIRLLTKELGEPG